MIIIKIETIVFKLQGIHKASGTALFESEFEHQWYMFIFENLNTNMFSSKNGFPGHSCNNLYITSLLKISISSQRG